jgi:hypothetical protein
MLKTRKGLLVPLLLLMVTVAAATWQENAHAQLRGTAVQLSRSRQSSNVVESGEPDGTQNGKNVKPALPRGERDWRRFGWIRWAGRIWSIR